ncbi:hypothetical protein BD779DRAFT_1471962 [Infundibulicybe gibba]|nr:hypothetical protein BD779DRAFT_1471962 [Infundibulicybe gibba]
MSNQMIDLSNCSPSSPENWDDDLSFTNNQHALIRAKYPYPTPSQITTLSRSYRITDSDVNSEFPFYRLGCVPPRAGGILEDKKNMKNWDDDFEDSPVRRGVTTPSRKSAAKIRQSRLGQMQRQHEPAPESWDDEFETAHQQTPSRAKMQPRYPSDYSESDNSDLEELGFVDKDEDRTVTARSRRQHYPERGERTPSPSSRPILAAVELGSPNSGGILSRIGSVKKWGVRRKRASTTPSEVATDDNNSTPRPQSSLSSLGVPQSPVSPTRSKPTPIPQNGNTSNWFFRASSAGSPLSSFSGSNTDLTNAESPSKLLRRGVGLNGGGGSNGAEEGPGKRPMSMQQGPVGVKGNGGGQRHASYGGLGIGRAGKESVDDLARGGTPEGEESKDKEVKEREGSRGFMGSVRKISLVGRHKKTKSSVSLGGNGGPTIEFDIPALPNSHTHQRTVKEEPDEGDAYVSDQPPVLPHPVPDANSNTPLLPPIELQPPSPPRPAKIATSTQPQDASISPRSTSGKSIRSPITPHTSKSPLKTPSSPQSASLGRSSNVTSPALAASGSPSGAVVTTSGVPRRNSLGDLKIPARISQAQVGLRRDLGMVREFAGRVEQLKELQVTYHSLVVEVQTILDMHANLHAPSRATSPSLFRPITRNRANTNTHPPHDGSLSSPAAYKQLASAFYTINSKYRISWECAELLIELGGGTATPATPAPSSSVSAPVMHNGTPIIVGKKSRERAITLAGDESKAPPRQLVLLKEMLNNPDSSFVVEELTEESHVPALNVNRDWRWGDAMNSTVTLPSEDSAGGGASSPTKKKRRTSRLGMSGLRDMLRSLKRHHSENLPPPVPPILPPIPVSTTSLSTDSSLDSHNHHRYPHEHITTHGRRRAKTSTDPASMRSGRDTRPTSPYGPSSFAAKASPRRPSLASIFRIGKNKSTATATPATAAGEVHATTSGASGSSTGEEEDWDRMDSASDLDAAARALGIAPDGTSTVRGTTRGRSPYLQELYQPNGHSHSRPITPSNKRHASGSQSSLLGGEMSPPPRPHTPYRDQTRPTRLSNVEEHTGPKSSRPGSSKSRGAASPARAPSRTPTNRIAKSGSVRSMPPGPVPHMPLGSTSPVATNSMGLAMTPENIKPLLENAKEVQIRLGECVREIQALLPEPPLVAAVS